MAGGRISSAARVPKRAPSAIRGIMYGESVGHYENGDTLVVAQSPHDKTISTTIVRRTRPAPTLWSV